MVSIYIVKVKQKLNVENELQNDAHFYNIIEYHGVQTCTKFSLWFKEDNKEDNNDEFCANVFTLKCI